MILKLYATVDVDLLGGTTHLELVSDGSVIHVWRLTHERLSDVHSDLSECLHEIHGFMSQVLATASASNRGGVDGGSEA